MTNFTAFEFNGATYTRKPNNYCYVTLENGHISRISKAEFEAKLAEFEAAHEEQVEKAVSLASESIESEEVREAAETLKGQGNAKKAPRKRTPKDIGYRNTFGETEVILTEKQVDFMYHLPDTCFWENGVDSAIWVDCLCDDIKGQFAGKPMTVGAMISTLCEKGIGVRSKERMNGRKCTSFALTALGKLVAKDLGL